MENEKTIGYIDNLVSFGFIAPKRKSLIITDKRLLIVDASSATSIVASVGIGYALGVFGRGITNRVTKENVKETTEKLSQTDLDQLLNSDPNNLALDIASISNIEINRKKIIIKTDQKTFKYKLGNPDVRHRKMDTYSNYVDFLKAALSNKVTAKNP
ncbi:hypothetical protein M1558_04200 [Candidatus Parvarchaeota archaeon]|nr:hypothetical protein [Candidatus Parvarchaeota archaeon]